MEERKLGQKVYDKIGLKYIKVYRAVKKGVIQFYDKDYVTFSETFAKEHAENNHVYYDEPFDVIYALISSDKLYDAYNPGEYFYVGKPLNGKVIYTSLGPEEFEGFNENHLPQKNKSFLRNIISEEIKKLLDENYESVKEIHQLADEVIKFFAKKNINIVLNNLDDVSEIKFFNSFLLSEVYQNSNKQYKILEDFLIETKINILFLPKIDNRYGDYSLYPDEKYNPSLYREINIYYENEFLIKLQNLINESIEFNEASFYFILHLNFLSHFIHEIQHAFDDYRSKSQIFKTKEFREFIETVSQKEINNKKKDLNDMKKYLNFTHEVWARFAQTVEKINFTTTDFEESPDGNLYLIYKMKSIKTVLISFYNNFYGWSSLYNPHLQISPIQRRLQKAVVQFWHKEQEFVKEKNKNPERFA